MNDAQSPLCLLDGSFDQNFDRASVMGRCGICGEHMPVVELPHKGCSKARKPIGHTQNAVDAGSCTSPNFFSAS